jgi:hypothetical protein
MRRDGHIRERSPGSFEVRYWTGTKTETFTVRGSLRDAKAALHEKLESLRLGTHVDPTKMTLGEWLDDPWLSTVRQDVSPKTHERYGELVRGYLIPALGPALLCKLSPTAIQTAFNDWATSGRRDGKPGGLA